MTLQDLIAGIIVVVLVVYALLGGADFGGGVWDLAATGPRARSQRALVANAIGPVWEANHVWMIVAVVLLFTAYPPAFAAIMTALHIPVTLMLIGIVLRGSSFVFRKFAPAPDDQASPLQLVFAVSSLLTPVMLGVVIGTISTPEIGWRDGVATGGFLHPWLRPFPWAVGLLTLALFAWLAASYLPLETADEELREDFRFRSIVGGFAVAVFGGVSLGLMSGAATHVFGGLTGTAWGRTLLAATTLLLAAALVASWRRRYAWARVLSALVAGLVIVGWAGAMRPWIVVEGITLAEAAGPRETLELVAWILLGGGIVLLPAYVYLVATFKGRVLFRRE